MAPRRRKPAGARTAFLEHPVTESPRLRIPEAHRGLVFVATAAMLWSSGGLFIKMLPMSAFQIAGYRSLVAGLAILLAQALRKERAPFPRDLLSLAGSVTYAAVLILFVVSTKLTTAANAIFLQYAAPIYLLFLEPWTFRKPFPRRDLWAVAACLAGMSLFFAGHLERGGLLGNLLGALSGLALALFSLLLKWQRVKRPGENPILVVVVGNFLVAFVCLPLVLPHPRMDLAQAGSLIYLGIFQLGISYMLFTAGMRYLSATAAIITSMLEAVFNPVWVFLGVGERPSPCALAGGAVILGVIAWYNLRRPPVPQSLG
jgi:drug/metabolite transporter (DMT)-like permease